MSDKRGKPVTIVRLSSSQRVPRVVSGKVLEKPRLRQVGQGKTPNSLRHELEDVLLGLCDVWFEDIKPHLIRGNVKLHLNGCGGPGDRTGPGDQDNEQGPSVSHSPIGRLLHKASRGIDRAMSQAACAVSPVSSITEDSRR